MEHESDKCQGKPKVTRRHHTIFRDGNAFCDILGTAGYYYIRRCRDGAVFPFGSCFFRDAVSAARKYATKNA